MIRAEDAEVRNGFLFVRNNTTNVWSEDILVAKEKKRALFLRAFQQPGARPVAFPISVT